MSSFPHPTRVEKEDSEHTFWPLFLRPVGVEDIEDFSTDPGVFISLLG